MSKPKPLPAPLPCPFCGGKPATDNRGPDWTDPYAVYCYARRCPATPMIYGSTMRIAIQHWNKRAKI